MADKIERKESTLVDTRTTWFRIEKAWDWIKRNPDRAINCIIAVGTLLAAYAACDAAHSSKKSTEIAASMFQQEQIARRPYLVFGDYEVSPQQGSTSELQYSLTNVGNNPATSLTGILMLAVQSLPRETWQRISAIPPSDIRKMPWGGISSDTLKIAPLAPIGDIPSNSKHWFQAAARFSITKQPCLFGLRINYRDLLTSRSCTQTVVGIITKSESGKSNEIDFSLLERSDPLLPLISDTLENWMPVP